MQFQDELAAGTVLVRPALQSPDYQPGTSGWAVMIDGSAEFNNITIRGGTTVGGQSLYYNGTPAAGNLILSIAAQAGADEFGNAYQDGLTVYGSSGSIHLSTANTEQVWSSNGGSQISVGVGGGTALMSVRPPNATGVVWGAGSVVSTVSSRLGANTPVLALQSPTDNAFPGRAGIQLFGGHPGGQNTEIVHTATQHTVLGDMTVNGKLVAANRFVGSVNITPVPNTPTSVTVTYPALLGAAFRGQATAFTTLPGTEVLGVGINPISSTSATIYLTRTNNTLTRVDFTIEGV